MNTLKRTILSLIRNFSRTVIIFTIIFIFGILITVFYSAMTSIENVNRELRRRMRPIITLVPDYAEMENSWREAGGQWYKNCDGDICIEIMGNSYDFPQPAKLTSEKLSIFLANSYIDTYHITLNGQFETNFIEFLPIGAEKTSFSSCIISPETEQCFEHLIRSDIHNIRLQSDSNNRFIEISEGLIELSQGHELLEVEHDIWQESFPLIVSENFAQTNHFQLGSIVKITKNLYEDQNIWLELNAPTWDDIITKTLTFEFMIVGLFQVIPDEEYNPDTPWIESNRQRYLENMFLTSHEAMMEIQDTLTIAQSEIELNQNIYLFLNDPILLSDFIIDVSPDLPDYWTINYVLGEFDHVVADLRYISTIFYWFFLIVCATLIFTLILLFIYHLSKRKNELGLYLALGESKIKILTQLIFELFIIMFFSLILSLIPSQLISRRLSTELILTELVRIVNETKESSTLQDENSMTELGLGRNLRQDLFTDKFKNVGNLQSVIVILLFSKGMIFTIFLIPCIFSLSQSPKKLLEY